MCGEKPLNSGFCKKIQKNIKNIKKSSKKVLTLRVKDGNIYKSLGGTPQEGKNLENKIVPDKK